MEKTHTHKDTYISNYMDSPQKRTWLDKMSSSTPAKVLSTLFADTKPAGARRGGAWNGRQTKYKINHHLQNWRERQNTRQVGEIS